MAHLCGRAIDMLVVLQSSVVINHHQSSSSCLPRLRLASCREPLAASRLQRATCGESGAEWRHQSLIETSGHFIRQTPTFSPNALRCQKTDQLKQLNSELPTGHQPPRRRHRAVPCHRPPLHSYPATKPPPNHHAPTLAAHKQIRSQHTGAALYAWTTIAGIPHTCHRHHAS